MTDGDWAQEAHAAYKLYEAGLINKDEYGQRLDDILTRSPVATSLAITPTSGLKVGDTITGPPLPDRRNWWQRRAPKWLGGQDAPKPFEGTITEIVSGTATIIEDREP